MAKKTSRRARAEQSPYIAESEKLSAASLAYQKKQADALAEELDKSLTSDGNKASGGKSSGGGSKQAAPSAPVEEAIPLRGSGITLSGALGPQSQGSSGSGKIGDTHTLMMNELLARGVKPEVAAGAVGSMMGESGRGLNPHAYNPNDNGSPSGGIAQWHKERLDNLYNFAGTRDIKQISAETQAKFLGHELDTSHNHVLKSLLNSNTVADGNRIWTTKYEVPANASAQVNKRQGNADAMWEHWNKNGGAIPADNSPKAPPAPLADRRVEAIPTPNSGERVAQAPANKVASADTGVMNDASPSGQQSLGGVNPTQQEKAPTAIPLTGANASLSPVSNNSSSGSTQMASASNTALPTDVPLPPTRPPEFSTQTPAPTSGVTPAATTPAATPGTTTPTALPETPTSAPVDVPLPPKRPEEFSQPQQQAQQDDSPFGFLSDLFKVPENLNSGSDNWDALYGNQQPPQDAAIPDNSASDGGVDMGGLDFGGVFNSFGFKRGGVVKAYALGGPIEEQAPVEPTAIAPHEPVALVPVQELSPLNDQAIPENPVVVANASSANDVTPPATTPPTNGDSTNPSPAPAPAPAPRSALPEYTGDTAPYYTAPKLNPEDIPLTSQERADKQYYERHAAMNAEHDRRQREEDGSTLGGLIGLALRDAVGSINSDIERSGIPQKMQRQQTQQGIATPEDRSIFDDIAEFITGEAQAKAMPQKVVDDLGKKVDPNGQLNDGVRNLAVLAAGYKHALESGEPGTAKDYAVAMVWHSQMLSQQFGEQAYSLFKTGNTEDGLKALKKAYGYVPDGNDVRLKKHDDGSYTVQQVDVTSGKVVGTMRAEPQDFIGAALGLKNGTGFFNQVLAASQGKAAIGNEEAAKTWATNSDNATTERSKISVPLFDRPPTVPDDPNKPAVAPLSTAELEKSGIVVPTMPPRPPPLTSQEWAGLGAKDRPVALRQRAAEQKAWDVEAEAKRKDYATRVSEAERIHRLNLRGEANATRDTSKREAELDKPLSPTESSRLFKDLNTTWEDSVDPAGKAPAQQRTDTLGLAHSLLSDRRNNITPDDAIRVGAMLTAPTDKGIKLTEEGGRKYFVLPDGRKIHAPNAAIEWRNNFAKSHNLAPLQ